MLRIEQQKGSAVSDVFFQRLIISVADRQAFIVPDLPSGFVQCRNDPEYPFPVFMRIADEYVRFIFIRRERRGKFIDPRRKQSVKCFVMRLKIVEYRKSGLVIMKETKNLSVFRKNADLSFSGNQKILMFL